MPKRELKTKRKPGGEVVPVDKDEEAYPKKGRGKRPTRMLGAYHHSPGGQDHDQKTHGGEGGGTEGKGEKGGREYHGGRDMDWKNDDDGGGAEADIGDHHYRITETDDGWQLRVDGSEVASGMKSIEEAKSEAGAVASGYNLPTKTGPKLTDREKRMERVREIGKKVEREHAKNPAEFSKKLDADARRERIKKEYKAHVKKEGGFKQSFKDFMAAGGDVIEDIFGR